MLEEHDATFSYRDYRREPLSEAEITEVLRALDRPAGTMLRKRDRAYRELGLTGTEPESELISLMAANPTLLERPIGVRAGRAVLGRPPEKLLELLD